jgi:intein/homing endonuclease
MFEKHAQSGQYQIAYHQFVKSIILGEHKYYSQERSGILNIFDFDYSKADSHFMKLRILKYLYDRLSKDSIMGKGYIEIDEIISVGAMASIQKEGIMDSITMLLKYNLIESDNLSREELKTATYLRITNAGKYYLNSMIYEFVYLDCILFDTPISDRNIFERIKAYSNCTELDKRIKRTEYFLEYLENAEKEEAKEHPEYGYSELTNKFYSEEIKAAFENFIREMRIERASYLS